MANDDGIKFQVRLATDKIKSDFASASTEINNFGNSVAKAFGAITLGAVSKELFDFGKSAIQTGIEFNQSMSQVAVTMGLTREQMEETGGTYEKLSDFAREMGATTTFSASESAEALNYMALAGLSAEESIGLLPDVLKASVAGSMDLASASDMITDTMSALGIELENSTAYLDAMLKTSQNSNTSFAQLGEAFLTVGASAKILAGGYEEASTAIGLLGNAGTKGSEAGTSLRNIILSLTAPTDAAADALTSLGVSVFDTEGNMRSLEDVFTDLKSTLDTKSLEEQQKILNTIFNKTDLADVGTLMSSLGDTWDDLEEKVKNSSGALEDANEIMSNTPEAKIANLSSAYEALQLVFAETLVPVITEGIEALTALITLFNESPEAVQKLAVIGTVLTAIGTAIGALVIFIGSVVSAIGAIGTALAPIGGILSTLGATFTTVFTAIAGAISLPVVAVVALVAAIAGIGVAVYKNWEDIKVWTSDLVSSLSEFFSGLGESISSAFGGIVDSVKEKFDTIKATVTEVINAIVEEIQNKFSAIADYFSDIANSISDFFNAIYELVVAVFDLINAVVQVGLDEMKAKFSEVFEKIKEIISPIVDFFKEKIDIINTYITDKVNIVVSFIKEKIDAIYNIVNPIIEKIKGLVNSLYTALSDEINEFVETIKEKLSEIVNSVTEKVDAIVNLFKNGVDSIKNFFIDLKNDALQLLDDIKNAITGVFDGFTSKISAITSKISDLTSKITGTTKSADNVTTQSSENIPKHKLGLDEVPYDDYLAYLHKGEAVLTAQEAEAWRNGQVSTQSATTQTSTQSALMPTSEATTSGSSVDTFASAFDVATAYVTTFFASLDEMMSNSLANAIELINQLTSIEDLSIGSSGVITVDTGSIEPTTSVSELTSNTKNETSSESGIIEKLFNDWSKSATDSFNDYIRAYESQVQAGASTSEVGTSTLNNNTSVTLEVSGKELAKTVVEEINDITIRTGKSPLLA